jgi:hypothetical protein
MLSPLPPPMRQERLTSKLVRCDHEDAVRDGIADVDDPQVAAAAGLTYCHSGAFSTGTIFCRVCQDFLHIVFFHVVVP